MNTKIKIPKGWRVLRKGTRLVATDECNVRTDLNDWMPTMYPGECVGSELANCPTYIRRITRPAKRRGKKL
jgi:hypothetical protein